VAAGTVPELVVALDQLVSRRLGPIRVDAERTYPERPSQRLPLEVAERRQRLDLGQADYGVGVAQRALLSAC